MAKALFIQDIMFEFMGPMYISAALKKGGHQCDLVIVSEEKDWLSKVKDYAPDMVLFSTMTGPHKWALQKAKEIKASTDTLCVFGGSHPTFFPEIINEPQVDIVCIGEGEQATVELADAIDKKKDYSRIKNLLVKKGRKIFRNDVRPLIEDLDVLPFADRTIYDKYPLLRDFPTKRFLTGRGCPYNCTYCFNHIMRKIYSGKGRYVRHRSARNIIDEIKLVMKNYDLRLVRFPDDTISCDKKWFIDFLRTYKREINLPFTCLVRVNEIDENVVRAMKEAKCRNVFFGVETGDEKIRNTVLKRNISEAQLVNAAALFRKHGIKFGTYSMFGLPGETVESAFKTIYLNRKLKPNYPFSTIFQPYPRTELADYAVSIGELSMREMNSFGVMSEGSLLRSKDIKRLINLQRFYFLLVKFPFLQPLVKQLIKLEPNRLFKMIYELSFALAMMDSVGMGWLTTAKFAIKLRGKL